MKRDNNSRSRRGEDSQPTVRKNNAAKPADNSRKPRRQSFTKARNEESRDSSSKKFVPGRSRNERTSETGDKPFFKKRDNARPDTRAPRRKPAFTGKAASEEKSFDRTPKGKGVAKRTFVKRDKDEFERKPFSRRTDKLTQEKRDFKDSKFRKADTRSFKDKDGVEVKGKFFKNTAREERPQKRIQRAGYNTDKKKTGINNPTPEYNLRKFEQKHKKENTTKPEVETIRLNRYISNAGICSRREADTLIESGEIKVNGKVVTEMGYQVGKNDIVKYGNRVLNKEKLVYVLLNKPKGYITTTEDPEERKTVMDLVGNACEQRIYPVGRLDRNTSGLLLFTNDGELAEKLAHPSNEVKKIYQVELNKPIVKEDFQKVLEGVQLEDGLARVDELAVISPDNMTLGLELHIGRNRIVRRIFEYLGYEVAKLDRVSYAGLTKKDLPRGHWRFLSEKEVIKLKYFV